MAPRLLARARSYAQARRAWIRAGKPTRTDERVRELLTVCQECPDGRYRRIDGTHGKCDDCGCMLNLGTTLNKLRWATEECPRGHWRAEAHQDAQETQDGTPDDACEETGTGAPEPLTEAHRNRMMDDERQNQEDRRAARKASREARKARIRRKREQQAQDEAARGEAANWVNHDPLEVFTRHKEPATLKDIWRNAPGFLVCGGPSLKHLDLSRLGQRGVVSLGVNNVAGYAPVRAMTFSDPAEKFHHGIFLDPAMMKLVPLSKLKECIRVKTPGTNEFIKTPWRVMDCPNVWGYRRDQKMTPEVFLTDKAAHWGRNNKGVAAVGGPKILFTFFLGLRLMHYLGVRRVYLLGVDFNMSTEAGYAFGQARWPGAVAGNHGHYRKAQVECENLRPKFEAAGYHVYNCNPQSHLTAFDYVPFEDAMADCLAAMPPEPFDLSGWYEKAGQKQDEEDDRGADE